LGFQWCAFGEVARSGQFEGGKVLFYFRGIAVAWILALHDVDIELVGLI
jgi:hypothetical protein